MNYSTHFERLQVIVNLVDVEKTQQQNIYTTFSELISQFLHGRASDNQNPHLPTAISPENSLSRVKKRNNHPSLIAHRRVQPAAERRLEPQHVGRQHAGLGRRARRVDRQRRLRPGLSAAQSHGQLHRRRRLPGRLSRLGEQALGPRARGQPEQGRQRRRPD